MTDDDHKRRHPNRAERLALQAAEVAVFMKQIGRKAQKGVEPNDRKYDRDVEQQLRRMDPLNLDRLLREDEE